MPYYLTSLEVRMTLGSRQLKWPIGSDSMPGANWIILGNAVLMYLPSPFLKTGMTLIADDKLENMTTATRNRLATLLGDRTYSSGTTFGTAVVDFMRNAPVGKWPSLRPSKSRARYEIWLGPGGRSNLFYSEASPVGPSTNSIEDTFERTAANLNGSTSSDAKFTWAEVDGTEWLTNGSGAEVHGSDTDWNTARAGLDLDTDDHYAQATVQTFIFNLANLYAGLLVRWTAGTNGYGFEWGGDGLGANLRRIYKYDTDATLTSDTEVAAPSASDVLYVEADGSSLTAKVNSTTVLGPTTDTSHSGQLRTGISCYSIGADSNLIYSVFNAGDLTPASGGSKFAGKFVGKLGGKV